MHVPWEAWDVISVMTRRAFSMDDCVLYTSLAATSIRTGVFGAVTIPSSTAVMVPAASEPVKVPPITLMTGLVSSFSDVT